MISNSLRRFSPVWFDQYEGFSSWNKSERFATHVGGLNSFHNIAVKMCDSLMNQKQSIAQAFYKHDDMVKNEYRLRLNASVDASRYLLRQRIPFRAHDESEDAGNKGNFLELIRYTADQNEAEQMAIVLRFVDKNETIKERFIGVVHVKETSSLTLKLAIDGLFAKYGLSLKNVRGQGYDGATKRELQKLRDDGWDSLMVKVSLFCKKHDIEMIMMEDGFVGSGRRRKKSDITNLHHYKISCFNVVLDLQLQEFNDRFTEQLDIYIDNIREDGRFNNLESLGDLSRLMVETQKHLAHPLVYRLLKLALTLPVATATVERCFSAMKFVKTASRNRIGDQFLSDCLVCYIEKDLFASVTNETVVKRIINGHENESLNLRVKKSKRSEVITVKEAWPSKRARAAEKFRLLQNLLRAMALEPEVETNAHDE
ncbi:uncharacterized protein LOC108808591 [Raphanus sativus]|uniref:Uncharacterized protein LOC108808591 n=1 Tax=Raphanus sativus TaxID=3726 RepID=A0A9W3BVX6_RAPSA|nr:uncharacterized protein LOC108808591 [Raphanus sativus]